MPQLGQVYEKKSKIIARCKGTITEGQNGSPVKLDRTRELISTFEYFQTAIAKV